MSGQKGSGWSYSKTGQTKFGNGNFLFEQAHDVSTIYTLYVGETAYEIFTQPGKEVVLHIKPDTVTFSGESLQENHHLLSDKFLNEGISTYLNGNWYQLHRLEETAYLHKIDSLKGLYLDNMPDKELNQEFVAINTASIHYAFDRLLLRYPTLHYYFTGEKNPISKKAAAQIVSRHDAPAFLPLESYQKFVKTWLDKQLEENEEVEDRALYLGKAQLTQILSIIDREFNSKKLKDFWSYEYIKAHIEQYTWINGREFLESFINECTTPT